MTISPDYYNFTAAQWLTNLLSQNGFGFKNITRTIKGETVYELFAPAMAKWADADDIAQSLIGAGLSLLFDFDSTTTDSDPGAGNIRLNNSDATAATAAYIDDVDSNNVNVESLLLTMDDSTNPQKGYLAIRVRDDNTVWHIYSVTAVADNSGYVGVTISHIAGTGSFSNGDDVVAGFVRTGNAGAQGGVRFTFSTTTTDSDPGAGTIRLNNVDAISVTEIYIDDTDAGGNDVSSWIAGFDDSTNPNNKGSLLFVKTTDLSAIALYTLSSLTDATGYTKLTVSHEVGGASPFSDGDEIILVFSRTGDKGDTGAGTTIEAKNDAGTVITGAARAYIREADSTIILSDNGTDITIAVDAGTSANQLVQRNSSGTIDDVDTLRTTAYWLAVTM